MHAAALCSMVLISGSPASRPVPWQPERFPIGYWYGPPPEANTLETWQLVKEANFTFCGPHGGYDVTANRKMLDFCRQLALEAMVTDGRISWAMVADPQWQETVKAVVADYGSHPALFGYYLQDEPNHRLFEPLGKVSRAFKDVDPKHVPYINLFPTYASSSQLGTPTYRDHVDRFMRVVRPAVLSYDHYCLMRDGSDRPDYFENLELIRDAGLRHNTHAWNIILSTPHLAYRDPTEGEMRWQAYTTLAYGMKGILYFTYWTVPQWGAQGHAAIVDSDGKPGRLYPIVQGLNAEIAALGKTLLGLTSTGVYHTGDVPRGATRLGTDVPVQVPQNLPLVVGLFRDAADGEYVMIVNRDHDRPVEFEARFLPHVARVTRTSAETGAEEPLELTSRRATFALAAGDGALLRLVTRFVYPEAPRVLDRIDFQFKTNDDLHGWEALHSLGDPTIKDGRLVLTFTGDDPYLVRSFLRVPKDRYTTVKVRMKLTSGSGAAQLFWTTAAEPAFRDDKYLNFPVTCDGEFHDYEVPVADHPKWKGQEILAIRLDPVTGGAEAGSKVEIERIRGE